MLKDTSPTLNIGMLSAKDESMLRVKVVPDGLTDSYRLGHQTGPRTNRVRAYHEGKHGFIYFDPKKYTICFLNDSERKVKKRSGFYTIAPGDMAVISIKDKRARPTTNSAGAVYVIFDATTKSSIE